MIKRIIKWLLRILAAVALVVVLAVVTLLALMRREHNT